jgi:hypothetical protein
MNTVIKPLSTLIFSLTILFIPGCSSTSEITKKEIIGPTVSINVAEANLDFLGRVDTGAATTSINAKILNISADNIEYLITNKQGKAFKLRSRIVKQSIVKNAESREKRYVVELTINYSGVNTKTLVNLNDRADSDYKILLGRNWLASRYIVDVDKKQD